MKSSHMARMIKHTLDYKSTRPEAHCSRHLATLSGLGLGLVVTLPALAAALMSAGVGHGDYVAARVLFPAPMLLTQVTSGVIALPSILLALAQFPAYGAAIGVARGWLKVITVLGLLTAHAAAAVLCFRGWIPNFS